MLLTDIAKPTENTSSSSLITKSDLTWVRESIANDGFMQTAESIVAYLQRSRQLRKAVPELSQSSSVLYVGARSDRMDFGNMFKLAGCLVDVLEIYKPNIDFLRQIPWLNKVIHDDVRNIDCVTAQNSYDTVFWWHGPEHIPREDLDATLTKLKTVAAKRVVCACPFGVYEQPEIYGNPWEKHRNALQPTDFEANGFQTSTLGRANLKLSNILAWYQKDKAA